MFCRTQLAPMRQVGQVGATRRTSVGSLDVELNTACSCLMFFSCGGVPAALALLIGLHHYWRAAVRTSGKTVPE